MKRWLKRRKKVIPWMVGFLCICLLIIGRNQYAYSGSHGLLRALNIQTSKADKDKKSKDVITAAIPEPSTYAMVALGILGLIAISRRKQNNIIATHKMANAPATMPVPTSNVSIDTDPG